MGNGKRQPVLPEPAADRLLVGRVGIGVEKADGHGVHPGFFQLVDDGINAVHVRFQGDRPVEMGPLGNAETERAGDEGRPLLHHNVVELAAGLPADGQEVLEPGCRQEGEPGAFPFEKGVGCDRGAVDDIEPSFQNTAFPEAADDGLSRVSRRGKHLMDPHLLRRQEDKIGESPAGVDPDSNHDGR